MHTAHAQRHSRPQRLPAWTTIPTALLALLAFVVLTAFGGPAHAQTAPANERPRIYGFDLRDVDRVVPGAELQFTVQGNPGNEATLRISGAQRTLNLYEVAPGTYEGTYVVGTRDQITPQSTVTAQLRNRNLVTTALLDEPLQRGWNLPVTRDATPAITRFAVTPGADRNGAGFMTLEVMGTPGGRASVNIPGARPQVFFLDEVRAGEYRGTYTVKAGDRIRGDRPLVARLRSGERIAVYEMAMPANIAALSGNGSNTVRTAWCANCGTVLAVNQIEVDGDTGYTGTVAGGVLGAVVGSQIGKGDGRTAAGVLGAIGGAVLGRQYDKRQGRRTQFEVVARMNDGTEQRAVFDENPGWRVGDQVRIDDNVMVAANTPR